MTTYESLGLAFFEVLFPALKGVPGQAMLAGAGDRCLAIRPPDLGVSLPLLIEIHASTGVVVLCSSRVARHGASIASPPGGAYSGVIRGYGKTKMRTWVNKTAGIGFAPVWDPRLFQLCNTT